MDARSRAKLAVRRSPTLWSSYVAVSFPPQRYKSARDAVCLPHHDLLVDGYPRTANSYAYNFLTRFHGDVRCVHHTHASATLKMARRFDTPPVVLVRDPLDAVTSNLIRSQGSLAYLEGHYEQYYDYVRDHADEVTVVPFETVTQDPVGFLEVVERETGLPPADPTQEQVAEANEAVQAHLERLAEAKYGDDAQAKKAVPDEDREDEKARVRAELSQRETIEELRDLYRTVLAEAVAPEAAAGGHM